MPCRAIRVSTGSRMNQRDYRRQDLEEPQSEVVPVGGCNWLHRLILRAGKEVKPIRLRSGLGGE